MAAVIFVLKVFAATIIALAGAVVAVFLINIIWPRRPEDQEGT